MPKDDPTAENPPLQRSLRNRLVLRFVLLGAGMVAVLTIVGVLVGASHVKQRILLQLASESAAKEDLIEQRLQRDWELVSLWSKRPDIRSGILEGLLQEAQEEGISMVGLQFVDAAGQVQEHVGTVAEAVGAPSIGGGRPVVTNDGWVGHVVAAPMSSPDGDLTGFLVAQFAMQDLLQTIFTVPEVGESAEVLLGHQEEGGLVLLHHKYQAAGQRREIGSLSGYIARNDPLARAVLQQEGVIRSLNYENRDVFAAYRYLPRLGWGLVLTIDAYEALIPVWALGVSIVTVGLLLLGMTLLLSVAFATRLTAPLQKISAAMRQLGPNHWQYEATVNTGDELELVDTRVAEMTARLQRLYENLEAEIRERTAALQEQYELDKAILESTVHGIIVVNADGNILSVNNAAADLLCHDAGLCRNLPVHSIFRLYRKGHPIDARQHPIQKCISTGQSVAQQADIHWSVEDANGQLLPITLTVTPVRVGNKNIGAVAVFRDVTQERHIDEVKSEFISLASHQLRTPLSVIKWYTELLDDEEDSMEKQLKRQYLTEIRNAGDRMSDLVDALLQAAQLESKGILAEKQEVDVVGFMKELSGEVQSLLQEKAVQANFKLPEGKLVINTDPVLMHIVLQNLVSNAVKYTQENGVITIALHKREKSVEFTVQDTGIGIPTKDRKNIFQRLFRAENAKNTVADGSGLGLYISQMIVEILGGTIEFESKEGTGTTFTVRLPIGEE